MLTKYKSHFAQLLSSHISIDEKIISDLIEFPPSNIKWDLAFPCFELSKTLKKSPLQISQEITWMLSEDSFFSKFIAVGPYINAIISKPEFNENIIKQILSESKDYGLWTNKNEKRLVEWWSPNTHKALHVWHLRNALMSESVCTILQAAWYDVIRTAYGGDIWAHVAKWIWYYLAFDNKPRPEQPEAFCKRAWLLYAQASEKAKENEAYKQEIHDIQLRLENGEAELVDLWQKTRSMSIAWLNDAFQELGCHIEKMYFESEVEQPWIKIVKDLEANNNIPEIKVSEWAIIADLESYDLGVFLLLKSNGTSLYSTKDLALAQIKEQDYQYDKSLYVVATEQNRHFKQLFKTLELMWKDVNKLHHLWYEMVELETWKMSSRDGSIILYHDYRDQTIQKVRALLEERDLTALQKDEIARSVTFGALKFSMLLQDSYKKIIFDMERALSFEWETGPYVQYTHARAASILRNAETIDLNIADFSTLVENEEHDLTIHLAWFHQAIQKAATEFRPNLIARYALDLSHKFNSFYQKHKVIVDDQALMHSRLLLVSVSRQVLENALILLGIDAPEVM